MKKFFVFFAILVVISIGLVSSNTIEVMNVRPKFRIGAPVTHPGGQYVKNCKNVIEAAGGELIFELCDINPIAIVLAIQRLIDDGCDGIMLMPTSESILPQIAEMCEAAGVFWSVCMRPVFDAEILDTLEASEYYVGNVMENDEAISHELTKILAQNGRKNILMISTSILDPIGETRERGLRMAAEEYGINIVAELHNMAEEEIYSTVSNTLIAKPEIDAVFRVGSFSPHMRNIIQAISDSNRSISYVSIDFGDISEEDFDNGTILAMAGGHQQLDASVSAAIMVNAITGATIPEKWAKFSYIIDYIVIRSSEELSHYNQFFALRDNLLFSDEAVRRTLLLTSGEKSDLPDYQQIINYYTIENIRRINENTAEINPYD